MDDSESLLRAAFERGPALRSKDLAAAGFSRIALSRALAAGRIRRLARGLYCLSDYRQSEHGDLVLVAGRVPDAVVCLLSALRVHDLTTQSPGEIWIALPNKAWAPSIDYPPTRVVRFSDESRMYGTVVKDIDGAAVRVTGVEKTIADCFKFRGKVGLDVALEALREAGSKGLLDRDELWRCARIDRVGSVMRPYLEALA